MCKVPVTLGGGMAIEKGVPLPCGANSCLLPGFVPALFDILWLVFIHYFTSPNWDILLVVQIKFCQRLM